MTLLELIIVIFIISLVVGLGTVSFTRSLPSSKADATVREMIAALRQLRAQAVTTGERIEFTINLDTRQYGPEGKQQRTWPEEVLVRIHDTLAGEIIRGEYRFVFHPTGATEGGTIFITGGKKQIRLDLDPVVGALATRTEER